VLCRLLGPLEFRAGGDWTGVSAPKLRALLATLLLRRGQVVSTGQLVDELWGDDPPLTARKLVSGYVLRLRRLISDPDGRVLVTSAPGYRLLVRTILIVKTSRTVWKNFLSNAYRACGVISH
jgi:DNA-binding SARP family transcriptional activator